MALLAALSGAAHALASRRCRCPLALDAGALVVPSAALWLLGFLNTTLLSRRSGRIALFSAAEPDADQSEHVVAYLPLQLLDREPGVGRAIAAYEYPQL
ncbi:MAG: hypothetical protein U0232_04165 [Thermomicrobiales bacterium]